MDIVEKKDIINYARLKNQRIVSFNNRVNASGLNAKGDAIITGNLISLGAQGIQKLIDNRKKRYTTEYNFALTDLYFYDQLSTESSFFFFFTC